MYGLPSQKQPQKSNKRVLARCAWKLSKSSFSWNYRKRTIWNEKIFYVCIFWTGQPPRRPCNRPQQKRKIIVQFIFDLLSSLANWRASQQNWTINSVKSHSGSEKKRKKKTFFNSHCLRFSYFSFFTKVTRGEPLQYTSGNVKRKHVEFVVWHCMISTYYSGNELIPNLNAFINNFSSLTVIREFLGGVILSNYYLYND